MGFKMKSSVEKLCSPLQSVWDTNDVKEKRENSKKEYKEKHMKKYEGSAGEKFVNAITPKTAGEAVTMIAGGGLLGNLGKLYKTYKNAKLSSKILKS